METFFKISDLLALEPFDAAVKTIKSSFEVGMVRGGLVEYLNGIQEEIDELRAALLEEKDSIDHVSEEMGDVIFTTVILWCFLSERNPGDWAQRTPHRLLQATATKFGERLLIIEEILNQSSDERVTQTQLRTLSTDQWKTLWRRAKEKQREKNTKI